MTKQKVGLQHVIQKDPSLVWYTKDRENLTDESILEHVLNYGSWGQFQSIISSLGMPEATKMYAKLADKSRNNLKPRVKHYFDLYFSTHAPEYFN